MGLIGALYFAPGSVHTAHLSAKNNGAETVTVTLAFYMEHESSPGQRFNQGFWGPTIQPGATATRNQPMAMPTITGRWFVYVDLSYGGQVETFKFEDIIIS